MHCEKTRRVEQQARGPRENQVFGLNMVTGNKIRIYDLAKELKLDNKKVIEDARREGIDVSVPSNTVPTEVAERIRAKYFPKKAVPKVGPRLVKVAHDTAPLEMPESEFPAASPQAAPVEAPRPATTPAPGYDRPDVHRPSVKVLL